MPERDVPGQVPALGDAIAVAAGGSYSIALRSDGTLWSWGSNWVGQLGNGDAGSHAARFTPVQVRNLTGVVAVAAGGSHTLAIDAAGNVWNWGYNYYGTLGDGTTKNRSLPFQVPGIVAAKVVAGSTVHSVAVARRRFSLSVENVPPGGGYVAVDPNTPYYYSGQTVTLQATPSVTHSFAGWSGFGSTPYTGSEGPDGSVISFTITEDMAIQANFQRTHYLVHARAWPPDGGSVAVAPAREAYDPGEQVTLQATAAPGWTFTGWAGTGFDTSAGATTTFDVAGDTWAAAFFTREGGDLGPRDIWTWGNNAGAQLGDGTTTNRIDLTVRQLGDIDGNGGPEPADVTLLRAALNGQAPQEMPERAFDLDANGAAEPTDLMWLIFILDGRPLP